MKKKKFGVCSDTEESTEDSKKLAVTQSPVTTIWYKVWICKYMNEIKKKKQHVSIQSYPIYEIYFIINCKETNK